jgi:hypothetical protein
MMTLYMMNGCRSDGEKIKLGQSSQDLKDIRAHLKV